MLGDNGVDDLGRHAAVDGIGGLVVLALDVGHEQVLADGGKAHLPGGVVAPRAVLLGGAVVGPAPN